MDANQIEALREFCRQVIADYCWGYGDPDGGEIQDVAEKLGLLVPRIATADDLDEFECEVGDTIYSFADWLDKPRGLSVAEPASGEGVTS